MKILSNDYEQYQANLSEIAAARDAISKSSIDKESTAFQTIEHSLSITESGLHAAYRDLRIRMIASYMNPSFRFRWGMPESEKPLRHYELRHRSTAYIGIEYPENIGLDGDEGEFEISLTFWAGDSEETESLKLDSAWLTIPWEELSPILDAHMRKGWEEAAAADRVRALQSAERNLMEAQNRLNQLRGIQDA